MSTFRAAGFVLFAVAAAGLPAVCLRAEPPDRAVSDNIRVTIVAIVASDRHKDVNPKLKDIAREVQKREISLTGYKLERTTCKPVAVGQKENFVLVDEASADITVLQKDDTNQRIRLAVKAPLVGEITYSTCYDKFFPILTRYLTKSDRERLIVAIMVKQVGKDAKDSKDAKDK